MNDMRFNCKPTLQALAVAVLITKASVACAGFVDSRQPPPAVPTKAPTDLDAIASTPLVLPAGGVWDETARGFGKDVTPYDALTSVLPTGVSLYFPGQDANAKVSWAGGQPRRAVILKILNDAKLTAHLENDGKDFVVEPVSGTAPAPLASVKPGPAAGPAVAASSTPTPVNVPPVATVTVDAGGLSVPTPAALAVPVFTFKVTRSDGMLSDQLSSFLNQHGYQLAWDIPDDLPLQYDATFTGDIDSIMQKVMETTVHMKYAARACEYDNGVFEVIQRAASCYGTEDNPNGQ